MGLEFFSRTEDGGYFGSLGLHVKLSRFLNLIETAAVRHLGYLVYIWTTEESI